MVVVIKEMCEVTKLLCDCHERRREVLNRWRELLEVVTSPNCRHS
jgi:hypothetical protein